MSEQHGADSDAHDIQVAGAWFNDGTAGVDVWCDTCEILLLDADGFLTIAQITEAAAEHVTPPAEGVE